MDSFTFNYIIIIIIIIIIKIITINQNIALKWFYFFIREVPDAEFGLDAGRPG